MPSTTTASIAIVPSNDKPNFPTIPDTLRAPDSIFFTNDTMVKMQVNPIARIKIHQNIVPTVESPRINSSKFTSCP